jgi:hypothetical protein
VVEPSPVDLELPEGDEPRVHTVSSLTMIARLGPNRQSPGKFMRDRSHERAGVGYGCRRGAAPVRGPIGVDRGSYLYRVSPRLGITSRAQMHTALGSEVAASA